MTANTKTTTARWHRLAEELARLATEADHPGAVQRVAHLVTREALALGASSTWPQHEDKHNAN